MTQNAHIVYILAGNTNGPIFIDAASDLPTRLKQHKSGKLRDDRFRIDQLVYVEAYDCVLKAKTRAKALKTASREWLDRLISSRNPNWQDLSVALIKQAKAA